MEHDISFPSSQGPSLIPIQSMSFLSYSFSIQFNTILLISPLVSCEHEITRFLNAVQIAGHSVCCQCWRSLTSLSPAGSDHQSSPMTVQSVPRHSYLEGHYIKTNDARKRGPVCWMRQEGLSIEIQHGDQCGPWENNSWGYKGGPHVDGRLR